jgi:hypothetical protein
MQVIVGLKIFGDVSVVYLSLQGIITSKKKKIFIEMLMELVMDVELFLENYSRFRKWQWNWRQT